MLSIRPSYYVFSATGAEKVEKYSSLRYHCSMLYNQFCHYTRATKRS